MVNKHFMLDHNMGSGVGFNKFKMLKNQKLCEPHNIYIYIKMFASLLLRQVTKSEATVLTRVPLRRYAAFH